MCTAGAPRGADPGSPVHVQVFAHQSCGQVALSHEVDIEYRYLDTEVLTHCAQAAGGVRVCAQRLHPVHAAAVRAAAAPRGHQDQAARHPRSETADIVMLLAPAVCLVVSLKYWCQQTTKVTVDISISAYLYQFAKLFNMHTVNFLA